MEPLSIPYFVRAPKKGTMDAIDQFAAEAVRFERWAYTEERNPGLAAREALVRISSLYVAALQLPQPFTEEFERQ